MTLEIRKVIDDSRFKAEINLKEFYDNFISEFEIRINSYQLVEIVMPIAKQVFVKSKFVTVVQLWNNTLDPTEAFEFLQKIEKTVKRDKEAHVRVWAGQIELHLMNKDKNGSCIDIATTRDMIEAAQKELDELPGVTPVHATFYKVSALYLREVCNYASYYREALRYLGCEDLNKLTDEEKHMQAMLLSFAALLGENIYNFGELVSQSILNSTKQDSF